MKFEWERIGEGTFRAKVFNGWIVTVSVDTSTSSIFVSDPHYQWSIEYDQENTEPSH